MASPILINGKEIKCPSSFSYTRSDLDQDSYRDINGNLVRNRISTKVQLILTWKAGAMDVQSMSTLLTAMDDVFFQVFYFDVHDGAMRTATFYASDKTAQMYSYIDGVPVFNEISVTLIEK